MVPLQSTHRRLLAGVDSPEMLDTGVEATVIALTRVSAARISRSSEPNQSAAALRLHVSLPR